ncbi:MAG: class I SAM-dependent methyltransferase [Nanoarchaeota archaeon]|nr:class I SAM-dependent methyltransferase [Nanoarchaeota archaeon]MBU1320875.1 class I SAM-dependent methyltransferase [Nanoarchaeota archaeon]MBU1597781.1 class I SAM-dependent methyltransferase [Nanoarchaeota archaeon]MBU2441232.1 class I SAM-dependent methyltransferase [Nanoarchaeota archaeon]
MGELLNIITPMHKKTKRDYLSRMVDEKVKCMEIAKKYEEDYWDGDRRYGYGGYNYMAGYWEPAAKAIIEKYKLTKDSKVLSVGCGKAFLEYEIKKLLPGINIVGFDISKHAINSVMPKFKDDFFVHKAQELYPFKDKEFDLVLCLTVIHNIYIDELKVALQEIERVGKQKFITTEAFRNEQELFNLQCWALTCELFFRPEEWIWLFKEFGCDCDYEFIYFE